MQNISKNMKYFKYRINDFTVRYCRFLVVKSLCFFKKISIVFSPQWIYVRTRAMRRAWFRLLRGMVFFIWRLWVRKIEGVENIPKHEPVIIFSNHLSYFDFFVLASILRRQTVFVAVRSLKERSFVGWFMKLDTIVYVDRERPGFGFFKELIRHLDAGKQVVIYPEGTRSRSGKMLSPKTGFVKLALKQNIPILPVAMRGTYEILPPNRRLPAFKKCDVVFGKKIYISPSTPLFKDVFFHNSPSKKFTKLSDEQLQMIAYRVMDIVRRVSGQTWDDSAQILAQKFCHKNDVSEFALQPDSIA